MKKAYYGPGLKGWAKYYWHEVLPGLLVIAILIASFLASSGFWAR